MPQLAVNDLVVGQRYTINHTFSGYQMNKDFRGVNAEGHARFDQFSYDPNTYQFYAIGDPDIPAQAVAGGTAASHVTLTPNGPVYRSNSVQTSNPVQPSNPGHAVPRKNRTRRNRTKRRRTNRKHRSRRN